MGFKKIVVPTDFTDSSLAAAAYAITIAERSKAEITFLHIIISPLDWVKLPLEKEHLYPEMKIEIAEAKGGLVRLVDSAEKKGIIAHQQLIFNRSYDILLQEAQMGYFDLIVMGSHGASGFRELTIGSNAQKVIRHSEIPVLVVKKAVNVEIENIVLASDFINHQLNLDNIAALAQNFNARLHLLYVNTPIIFRNL